VTSGKRSDFAAAIDEIVAMHEWFIPVISSAARDLAFSARYGERFLGFGSK